MRRSPAALLAALLASVALLLTGTPAWAASISVRLSAPTAGQTLAGPVQLSATTSGSVIKVQFFVDNVKVGEDLTCCTWTQAWDSTTVADGTHEFKAVASSAKASVTSAIVTATVQNGPPPQWSSSTPLGTWTTGGYQVNNNVWNSAGGPQTIYADAYNRWHISTNQPGTGTDDSVKSYPDTQKHVSIPLATPTSIPSTFDVTTPSPGGVVTPNSPQWNAAYDLWLDNFGTEVMVWNNWTMNWQYWFNTYHGEIVVIDGVTYAAYTNGNGGIWFIRQTVTNTGSVDLGSLLQWAVGRGWLRNTQTLGEIEYGFEVAYTGAPTTFALNDYSVATSAP
jgi:hypothetical protein